MQSIKFGTAPLQWCCFFFLCENHKNGHFSILVGSGCFFPFKAVLKSQYLEEGGQHDEHQDSRWFPTEKIALEDLQAIPTVIAMAEDHPVYSNDHEALIVVRRALEPIINDMQEAVDIIDGEMKYVQQD